MKRLLNAFVLCGCILFCGSCNSWHLGEDFHSSLIRSYYLIDTSNNVESLYIRDNTLSVCIPVRPYVSEGHTGHTELSKKYGDVDFNSWVVEGSRLGESWAFPFAVFEVVSDSDFDELHPAGTPLNDLMTIKYYTYRLYIENGYNHSSESNGFWGHWITKPLSEFVPEDAIFMDPFEFMELRFGTTPATAGVHHLTLTVSMENAKYYKVEFDMDFGGSDL